MSTAKPARGASSRLPQILPTVSSFAFALGAFVAVPLFAAEPATNEKPAAAEKTSAKPKRPNVVFILTDDQRADAIGCHEKPLLGLKTPHIDRIAREGVRFRNMFCTTSLCSPSRASFLTGLYAHAHGVRDNFTDLPQERPNVARRLKDEGYATAYVGKWHMGEDRDEPRPGFDYWASHKGQGKYLDNTFNINGQSVELKGYYTERVTDLAVEWISARGKEEKPFALILGHKAPHGPFVPETKHRGLFDHVAVPYPQSAFDLDGKPDWVRQRLPTWHGIYGPLYEFRKDFPDARPEGVADFERFARSYAAVIASVDDGVGRVYEALKAAGKLDDTLFVYASDNGFLLGEHGMIDKRTMHEESIRIPLLVRFPSRIPAGTVVDEMVLSVDFAPTVLDYCQAAPLAKTHGASWAKLAAGGAAPAGKWRNSFLYEYNYEKQFPYTPNVRGVRTRDWKYSHAPHGDGSPDRHKAELYHLAKDPGERRNLIDDPASQAVQAELEKELARLLAETDGLPDALTLDEGIQTKLPEKSIR